ncbi:paraquat-inducible protein A [Marinicella rhabdoformis]|uniref:paraquat-inducible protein A n=1 Tax=Marinicella rhabdoformis TaxID=2580566 RepID=UPI0012AECBDD|nr:paraquat-inducible protein A [Marinicella rhabdoformis]
MNKKTIANGFYFIFTVLFCAYLAYQAYGYSVAYENQIDSLSQQLDASTNAKSKGKKFLETITFNWYSGYSEEVEALEASKEVSERMDWQAQKHTKLFVAVLVLMLILHIFIKSLWSLWALLLVTSLALVTGWFAPILAIVAYQDLPVLGQTVFQFESKSIVSALHKLYESGQNGVALVIFLFTMVVPVLKTILKAVLLFSQNLHFSKKSISILKAIGKWSMLDVFVIAILVTYFSTKSGGATDATLQIGVYFFVAYVIASMILTSLINGHTNDKFSSQ